MTFHTLYRQRRTAGIMLAAALLGNTAMSLAVVGAPADVRAMSRVDGCADAVATGNRFWVPVSDPLSWRLLAFDHVPQHSVRFSPAGLEITVHNSAMPLLCPFEQTVRVSSIHVRGRIHGEFQVPPEKQGQKGYDDYTLRVGLVEPGPNASSARQLKSSPNWVKALAGVMPPGSGLAQVHFFNLAVDRSEIGRKRQHPISKLLEEEVVAVPQLDGSFDFIHAVKRGIDTCALWISTDGDDTKSSFDVIIERIELDLSSDGPRFDQGLLHSRTERTKRIS